MIFLADTSVVIKWVHAQGEGEVEEARRLLTAHRTGAARVLLLDLVVYEFGNVLLRTLCLPPADVVQQLDLLHRLCGPFVHPAPSWHTEAVELADRHQLSFSDGSWAAAAQALGCPLVSADRRLQGAGALSPARAAAMV